jgi:hypothetical protein
MAERLLYLTILCFVLALGLASATAQPLIPFRHTGDLYVLDHGCGFILRVTSESDVGVAVTRSDILAVTGESSVDFEGEGIAFDSVGSMYFRGSESGAILKRTVDGSLSLLVSESAILGAIGGWSNCDRS